MNFAIDVKAAWRWMASRAALVAAAAAIAVVHGTASAAPPAEIPSPTCKGKFPNPITDICWSCVFPIRVGGVAIFTSGQEDNLKNSSGLCTCSNPPKVGVTFDFWEPARIFEATRTPHCYVSLGGIKLDTGISAPSYGGKANDGTKAKLSFYQAHWYINPIFFWLKVLRDNSCLEQGVFDIAYATEYDPLWDNDLLSFFLSPDSALFANIIAQAACAADCVLATTGFPSNTLFWCAGCQGPMYPLTGYVASTVGGIQASSLLMQRMTNKLHREGLMWAGSGKDGLCTFYPQLIMDKTNYKSQLTFPVPSTQKITGRCCQPYGRTTAVWGAGKEFPYQGEDFAYQIFRKRSCCSGSSSWNFSTPTP